jgi:hypothetical protein
MTDDYGRLQAALPCASFAMAAEVDHRGIELHQMRMSSSTPMAQRDSNRKSAR